MRAVTVGPGIAGVLVLFGLLGCGGSATPFSPMNSSLQQQFDSAARSSLTTRPNTAPKLWDVKALLKPPLEAKLQPPKEDNFKNISLRIQEVSFNGESKGGRPPRITGVLASPVPGDKPRRLPGILLIGPAKETSESVARHLAASGYAVLALDAPSGAKDSELTPLNEETVFKAKPTLKDSALYESVSIALRAISFLEDQPGVDPRHIGVFGYGWGGISACLTGVLDKRVQAVSAVLTAPGEEKIEWNDLVGKMGEDRDKWVLSFDLLSYMGDYRQPMQFLLDPSDKFYPVANIQRLRQDLRVSTALLYRVSPRGKKPTYEEEARIWFDSTLRNAPKLPSLKAQPEGKETISITAQGSSPLKVVTLYYTLGNPMSFDGRSWKAVEARAEGNKWQAALPKEAVGQEMVYFAVAEVSRGGAVSTDMIPQMIPPKPS